MKLEFKPNMGSTHSRKRVEEGQVVDLENSGEDKGQNARSGGGVSAVFEWNYHYLDVFLRKFTNARFRVEYATVNVGDLNIFEDDKIITRVIKRKRAC